MNGDGTPSDDDIPSDVELLDWLEGRLDPAQAAHVEEKVGRADQEVHTTVSWLRMLHTVAHALPIHEPPPTVREGLARYFTVWSAAHTGVRPMAREIEVRVVFDSRRDDALLGVRAAGGSRQSVHLAFTADGVDLVVDAHRGSDGRLRLDGQVLPWAPVSAPVFGAWIAVADSYEQAGDGDALGRFTIRNVRPGFGRLTATNGEITVVAELDLETGPS